LLQTKRNFGENLVAGGGAHGVVEGFKPIHVDQQDGVTKRGFALRLREATLQAVKKQASVGQASECVMQGVVCELFLSGNALGYIAIHDNQFLDLAAGVADGTGRGFKDAPLAILVAQTILQAFADAGGPGFACGFQDFEAVVGMDLFEDGRGCQFRGRVAQDTLIRRAVVEAMALGVDQGDHVGGVFSDDAKELFAIRSASVGEVDPELLGNERQEQPKDQVRGGTRESHEMWTSRERSAEYGFS